MKLNPEIPKIKSSGMDIADLEWILQISHDLPAGSVIVEVGTMYGRSAAAWCQGAGDDKTVICVDTWEGTPQYTVEGGPHEMYLTEDVFAIFHENMHELNYHPAVHKMDSVFASKLFADCSLDVVFIDGDHFKIEEDLNAWYSKVKVGGLLCGHDWKSPNIQDAMTDWFPDAEKVSDNIWVVSMWTTNRPVWIESS